MQSVDDKLTKSLRKFHFILTKCKYSCVLDVDFPGPTDSVISKFTCTMFLFIMYEYILKRNMKSYSIYIQYHTC